MSQAPPPPSFIALGDYWLHHSTKQLTLYKKPNGDYALSSEGWVYEFQYSGELRDLYEVINSYLNRQGITYWSMPRADHDFKNKVKWTGHKVKVTQATAQGVTDGRDTVST